MKNKRYVYPQWPISCYSGFGVHPNEEWLTVYFKFLLSILSIAIQYNVPEIRSFRPMPAHALVVRFPCACKQSIGDSCAYIYNLCARDD